MWHVGYSAAATITERSIGVQDAFGLVFPAFHPARPRRPLAPLSSYDMPASRPASWFTALCAAAQRRCRAERPERGIGAAKPLCVPRAQLPSTATDQCFPAAAGSVAHLVYDDILALSGADEGELASLIRLRTLTSAEHGLRQVGPTVVL